MHQIRFRLGPRPRLGSSQRSPDPLTGFERVLLLREGKGMAGKEGKGRKGRKGEGREGRREGVGRKGRGKVASWRLGDGRPCLVFLAYIGA